MSNESCCRHLLESELEEGEFAFPARRTRRVEEVIDRASWQMLPNSGMPSYTPTVLGKVYPPDTLSDKKGNVPGVVCDT